MKTVPACLQRALLTCVADGKNPIDEIAN